MEKVIKILCPVCHGKIAIDEGYYKELIGKAIDCPHCTRKIIVPGNTERISHQKAPFEDMRSTMKIELSPGANQQQSTVQNAETTKCPKCGATVGIRDRVCIRCETKLTPKV